MAGKKGSTNDGNAPLIVYLRNCIYCGAIYGCKFLDDKDVLERNCKKCCSCDMPQHHQMRINTETTSGLCITCLEEKREENKVIKSMGF